MIMAEPIRWQLELSAAESQRTSTKHLSLHGVMANDECHINIQFSFSKTDKEKTSFNHANVT